MNTDKNTNKDNELKKDFKVAQYLYIAIYILYGYEKFLFHILSLDEYLNKRFTRYISN